MGQLAITKYLLPSLWILHCWLIAGGFTYDHSDIMPPLASNPRAVEDADYWRKSAAASLDAKLQEKRIIGKARNIIMFLGDGYDIQTMTATRILKGQKVDNVTFGEEDKLYMETFPYSGFSKTYCVDSQVADSACSTTAYLCGVKNNIGTIGVTPNVKKFNCSAQGIKENQVSSILAWAQVQGMSTGLVTTTQITDASPAGAYGHVANRDWECDADVIATGDNPDTCDDLAEQLILGEPGKNINVILAGGRQKFLPVSVQDSEGFPGQRLDGKNLIETWKSFGSSSFGNRRVYVENASDLAAVDASKTDYLMGLFSNYHLAYFDEQPANDDPFLWQMTQKAIEVLQKNPKGFFLFVEGGRIDHAHHQNWAKRSLWESIEFDRAIQKGDDMTYDDETLIVVTADHGHVMTLAGYADRGTLILHNAGLALDNLEYSILDYTNGPGYKGFPNGQRYNISQDDPDGITTQKVPQVPLDSETHGGQDVAILAKGPFAHLLAGVHEQNYIPIVMAYAACVGSGRTYCKDFMGSNAQAGSGWRAV